VAQRCDLVGSEGKLSSEQSDEPRLCRDARSHPPAGAGWPLAADEGGRWGGHAVPLGVAAPLLLCDGIPSQSVSSKRQGLGSISFTVTASESVTEPITALATQSFTWS
jgi:hypothetical protein